MKLKIILFYLLIFQILSKKKGKLISKIDVKKAERIKSTLETYVSDVEKMNIPDEIKDWVKQADLNERRVKKEDVTLNYNAKEGGDAKGYFAVIGKVGKKSKKVVFKYGEVDASLKPLDESKKEMSDEKVKKIVTRMMRREIEKQLRKDGKAKSKDRRKERKERMYKDKKKKKDKKDKKKKKKKGDDL